MIYRIKMLNGWSPTMRYSNKQRAAWVARRLLREQLRGDVTRRATARLYGSNALNDRGGRLVLTIVAWRQGNQVRFHAAK
jgi:L-serine deaminase